MDDLEILLPECGFSTLYKNIKNQPSKFECIICKTHRIDKEKCLSMPRNKYNMKKREVELELINLEKSEDKLDTILEEPDLFVDKNFKEIEQILVERRENLKSKIDDYYDDLKKRIDREKKVRINRALSHSDLFDPYEVDFSEIRSTPDFDHKMNVLQDKLKGVKYRQNGINSMLEDYEIGKNFKLDVSKSVSVEDFFGRIQDGNLKVKFTEIFLPFKTENDVKFFLKDRILTASSNDPIIRLCFKTNGKCIRVFRGHKDLVNSLCVLSNETFASGSRDKTIRIWNILTGYCMKILKGHRSSISVLKLFHSGELASRSADGEIIVWNYRTSELKISQKVDPNTIYVLERTLKFTITSGPSDKVIKIQNIDSGNNLKILHGHTDVVTCLLILNVELLCTGSYDKTIRIWDLDNADCVRVLKGHKEKVRLMNKLKNDELVSVSMDGEIRIWNVFIGSCLSVVQNDFGPIMPLEISENNEIAIVPFDGNITFWKVEFEKSI
ncbi:unnamed protein product [Brachionus calyciflorus]|uniref:Uncharacterized protein n=1 Tax=Brachionus calyciflorus TaxID=104777 RepID=A0A814CDA3_9BILA|nr:unnamed protein product [Brachionus calyciflorus]